MRRNSIYERPVSCPSESRMLSMSEIMHEKLNLHKVHPFGVYFHSLSMTSNEELSQERVKKAFYNLAKLHKLLRCCLFNDSNGDLWFKEVLHDADDWIILISYDLENETDWLHVAASNLNILFDSEKGPLWRVLWMRCPNIIASNHFQYQYVLVFVAMHLICDARSVFDVLTNQLMPLLENDGCFVNKPISFPKSYEVVFSNKAESELCISRCVIPFYIKSIMNIAHWLYQSSFSTTKLERFKQVDRKRNPSSLSYSLLQVNSAISTEFVNLCKLHKCSVHSALIIFIALAGIELAENTGLPSDTFKTITFPIDLRKFNKELNTSPMPLGQFVAIGRVTPEISQPFSYDKERFFCQAQVVNSAIKKQNKPTSSAILVSAVAHMLKEKRDLSFLSRYFFNFPQIIFSNIGSCGHYKNIGQIQVESQYFGVSTKDRIFVTLMTFNDAMRFCISYDNGWFNSIHVEQFGKKISDLIKDSVSSTYA